jgi:hypothetical protein
MRAHVALVLCLACIVLASGVEDGHEEEDARRDGEQAAEVVESAYREWLASVPRAPDTEFFAVSRPSNKVAIEAAPQQGKTAVVDGKKVIVVAVAKTNTKRAPKKPVKKISLAKRFHSLVKQVGSTLGAAITKIRKDKKLFAKASQVGRRKQQSLHSQAQGAKRHATGDSSKLQAIQTHMALASRDGARAFIHFVSKFKKGAKVSFWQSYKKAKADEHLVSKIYRKIDSHVVRASKAMKTAGHKMRGTYMKKLKAYWKAKYSYPGKTKQQKAAAKKKRHAAKVVMKKARSNLEGFKKTMRTAHHHAKKLREGLKHAMKKLHFLFKKARRIYRHTTKKFRVGFSVRAQAERQVFVARKPMVKPLQEVETHAAVTKIVPQKQAVVAPGTAALSAAKPAAPATKAVTSNSPEQEAEKKAVSIVKRAILQQKQAILNTHHKDVQDAVTMAQHTGNVVSQDAVVPEGSLGEFP